MGKKVSVVKPPVDDHGQAPAVAGEIRSFVWRANESALFERIGRLDLHDLERSMDRCIEYESTISSLVDGSGLSLWRRRSLNKSLLKVVRAIRKRPRYYYVPSSLKTLDSILSTVSSAESSDEAGRSALVSELEFLRSLLWKSCGCNSGSLWVGDLPEGSEYSRVRRVVDAGPVFMVWGMWEPDGDVVLVFLPVVAASALEVSEFVWSSCANRLSSVVRSMPLSSVFDDWMAPACGLAGLSWLKGSLVEADQAVVAGKFARAAKLYGRAMGVLGYEGHPGKCLLGDHEDLRLEVKSRWDMACIAVEDSGEWKMSDLPVDVWEFDDWRDLEPGSFAICDGEAVSLVDASVMRSDLLFTSLRPWAMWTYPGPLE